MTRLSLFFFSVLSLAGCEHLAEAPSATGLKCDPYAGTPELLERAEGHVIILGEMHGTNESPEAVRQLTCAALDRGDPVRIGLEADWTQGAPLDAALGEPFDDNAVFEAAPIMWTTLDGRGSGAILDLLKQVAAWRADGFDISVFAFDAVGEEWASAATRDAAMARHVDREIAGFDGVVLLFTGSFHAQKQPFEFYGETITPMASKISERPVFSLQMLHTGGEAWVNATIEQDDGTIVESIGALKMGADGPADGAARSIALSSSEPEAFDGAYFTGPISASAPAFPEPD